MGMGMPAAMATEGTFLSAWRACDMAHLTCTCVEHACACGGVWREGEG